MRLSTNYNRVNIITSVMVLIFTGIIYYFFIRLILTDNLDKDLIVEEDEIRHYTTTYHRLPLPTSFLDQQIFYRETKIRDTNRIFSNTLFYNSKAKKEEPGRSLFTSVKLGEKMYRVTITKSKVAAEDLIRIILLITLAVTLLLLISLFLINYFLLNRLWQPFYSTLSRMKSFEITTIEHVNESVTKIDEFNELNASVNAMAESVRKDYRELKSFTDNASHEMMTPLAVINSKLDSLLQTASFTQQQSVLLQDIYHATGRLSRLHQSLLLLAKIENNLISDIQDIDMEALIQAKISQFKELFERHGLTIESDLYPLKIKMSKFLADILLNNLLSNAVRHNVAAGEIGVSLKEGRLIITNTGKAIELEARLFDRFSKSVESEGMGLGLAIIKQICGLYGFFIAYANKNGLHHFTIIFHN